MQLSNFLSAYVRAFIESKVSLLKKIVLLLFAQPVYDTSYIKTL
jgi:hypothetical protein